MSASTVARSYADALFELGTRTGQRDRFGEAFGVVEALLESVPRFRAFLDVPTVDRADKKRVLRTAFEGAVPPSFLNFLMVVLDKRRQRLLPDIAREYRARVDEALGRVHAEVTLAREPDERLERLVAEGLSRRIGRTVVPHVRVDPRILGGIVVRFEDRVMDASVRRRLTAMRRQLLAAELEPAKAR